MFENCTSIVGGKGTTYDVSHTDGAYAHVDGTGNPGYFSLAEYDVMFGEGSISDSDTVEGMPANTKKYNGTDLVLPADKPYIVKGSTAIATTLVNEHAMPTTSTLGSEAQTRLASTGWAAWSGVWNGDIVAPGSTYTENYDLYLEAQWPADESAAEVVCTPVTLPEPDAVQGYEFKGWTDSNEVDHEPGEYTPTASGTLTAHWEPRTDTPYTVEHYQQNADDDGYTKVDTENKTGTTKTQTEAAAKSYDGFTVKSFSQAEIAADGGTVVKIYYDRDLYDLTVKAGAGTKLASGCTTSGKLRYGAPITLKAALDDGYEWLRWASSNTGLQADVNDADAEITMPAGALTMTATARKNPVTYTVEHYQQNIEDDGYTLADTQEFQVEPNTEVTPAVKTYVGFTSPGAQTVTVGEDDSTVVKYEYARNSYDFTLADDGNTTTDGSTASGTCKFGAKVTLKGAAKQGYTWQKWVASGAGAGTGAGKQGDVGNREAEITMPAGALTMTATASAKEDTEYKVEHYQQNVGDDEYALHETDDKTGRTGDKTAAEAKSYAGFTAQSFEQADIGGDGKTVVKIYYDRERYSYTLGSATGVSTEGSTESGSLKYGAEIKLKATVSSGYTWQKWAATGTGAGDGAGKQGDVEATATTIHMPAGNLVMTPTATASSNTKYTVRHWQADLAGNFDLTGEPAATEELEGTTGQDTDAKAKDFPGFECKGTSSTGDGTIVQAAIAGDGKTVVDIYYARKSYAFTLADDGKATTAGSTASGTYAVGTKITLKGAPKTGYTWQKWASSNTALKADLTLQEAEFEMPAGDLTMTATATESTGTPYTVEHYQQDLGGGGYTLSDTDNLSGTTGAQTEAEARAYSGFEPQAFSQAEIAADGKTVVKIRYDRKSYKFTLGSATGVSTDGSTATGTYPFGTEIALAAATSAGYTWGGWTSSDEALQAGTTSTSMKFGMPAGDLTMTPGAKGAAGTAYTVRHFQQEVDGSWPDEPSASEQKEGTTGEKTAAAAKVLAGFAAQPVVQKAIAADGTTVVDIRYARVLYKFTLGSAAGASTAGSTPSDTYRFGAEITLAGSADEGFTWTKWASSDTALQPDVEAASSKITMPAGDLTMTPDVAPGKFTPYHVRHLLMGTDGKTWELDEDELLYGETGAKVTPAVKDVEGFTAPAVEEVEVAADGSTVVEYRYARNKYDFTLGSCEGADTSGSSLSGSYYYGETIALTAKADYGYVVSGWTSSDASLQPGVSGASGTFAMPAGALEMTPVATVGRPRAVYHKNDGATTDEATKETIHEFGKKWTTEGAIFERDQHKLVGWNTERDGSGYDYTPATPQSEWLLTDGLDLYAVWKLANPPIAKIKIDTVEAVYGGAELGAFPLVVTVYDKDGALMVEDEQYTRVTDKATLAAVPGTGAKVGPGGMPLTAGVYTVDTIVTELNDEPNTYRLQTAFQVGRKALTVTADAAEKGLGSVDPAFAFSADGLAGGDSLGDVEAAREGGEDMGTYDIRPTRAQVLSADGSDVTSSYDITYVAGTLTIGLEAVGRSVTVEQKAATYAAGELGWGDVLAVSATDVYGRELAEGAFAWQVASCEPVPLTGARLGANGLPLGAGYYLATVRVAYPGEADATGTTTTAAFRVARAPLTVTAADASKAAGAADPAFKWTATGLVGSDKVASVKVGRAPGEATGSYAITPSAAVVTDASGNAVTGDYDITYKAGALKVTGSGGSGGKGGGVAGSAQAAIDADVANAVKTLTDADPAGSEFGLLQLKCAKAKKTSLKLTWKAVPGAARYVLFSSQCGKKFKYSVAYQGTAKSFTAKKLKKKTSYKFMCFAYDASGKRIATAKTVHAFTAGGKNGNVKKVTFKKKLTLKLKKSKKLKGKAVKMAGKKLKQHRKVMYESSNPKVATVNARDGKIKAVGKGKCVIYAYACDGKMAKCKVTVK